MRRIVIYIFLCLVFQAAYSDSVFDKVKDVTLDAFQTHGLDTQGNLSWRLSGETAERHGSIILIRDFHAVFHQPGGRSYELMSPGCRFLQSLKEVKSDSPVRLASEGILIEGIGYDAYLEGKMIRIRSSVRIVLTGKALKLDTDIDGK